MADDFDWGPLLEDGEELLWQGRPRQGWLSGVPGHDFGLVLFSSVTALFALAALTNPRAELIFPVLGLLFGVGYFHSERALRRSSNFAVTNRRSINLRRSGARQTLSQAKVDADSRATLLAQRAVRIHPRGAPPLKLGSGGLVAYQLRTYGMWPPGGVIFSPIDDAATAFKMASAQIRAAQEAASG